MYISRRIRSNGQSPFDAGFSLVEILGVLAILGIVGAVGFAIAVQSVLNTRSARDRQDARLAAEAVLAGELPAASGGSIAPAKPVETWTDVVVASGGAYVPPREFGATDAVPIRRQWMLTTDADGRTVFAVSATLLERDQVTERSGASAFSIVVFKEVR